MRRIRHINQHFCAIVCTKRYKSTVKNILQKLPGSDASLQWITGSMFMVTDGLERPVPLIYKMGLLLPSVPHLPLRSRFMDELKKWEETICPLYNIPRSGAAIERRSRTRSFRFPRNLLFAGKHGGWTGGRIPPNRHDIYVYNAPENA